MSFLDKVKATAGVGGGGASVAFDVQQRPSKRGDELVATLRVVGGKVNQKLNFVGVNVEWEGDWEYKNADGGTVMVRDGRGYLMMDRPANCVNTTLQAGQTIEIPIRLKIPSDAPLTAEKLKWKMYARADVEGADPTATVALEIRG